MQKNINKTRAMVNNKYVKNVYKLYKANFDKLVESSKNRFLGD